MCVMSRKEFISHLETGIAQYFADNDVLLSFDELNDIDFLEYLIQKKPEYKDIFK